TSSKKRRLSRNHVNYLLTKFNRLIMKFFCLLLSCTSLCASAPQIKEYNEIAIRYPTGIEELYTALSPQERIEAYYLYRATLSATRILHDKHHRHSLDILDIFEHLYRNRSTLQPEFVKDVETFLVYLWANHGPYFKREFAHNKRTPENLGLHH